MKDIYANNKAMILKVLIGILAIWLIVSIVQTNNKNKNKNKNGQANKKKEAKENTPTHHKKK